MSNLKKSCLSTSCNLLVRFALQGVHVQTILLLPHSACTYALTCLNTSNSGLFPVSFAVTFPSQSSKYMLLVYSDSEILSCSTMHSCNMASPVSEAIVKPHAVTAGQFASYVNVVSEAIELQAVCRCRSSRDYTPKSTTTSGQHDYKLWTQYASNACKAHCGKQCGSCCADLHGSCYMRLLITTIYEVLGSIRRLQAFCYCLVACKLCFDLHCSCKACQIRVDGIQVCGQAVGDESQCTRTGCHILHDCLVRGYHWLGKKARPVPLLSGEGSHKPIVACAHQCNMHSFHAQQATGTDQGPVKWVPYVASLTLLRALQ